jgi:hypothetical protein
MTSTTVGAEILKQDKRGRVRVSAERREALLEEFEKSAMSGAKFARLAGVKYATFANWVARRRRQRTAASGGESASGEGARPIRLFEAFVEKDRGGAARVGAAVEGLVVELPGGSRALVGSPVQLQMAAELVVLVAQGMRSRC